MPGVSIRGGGPSAFFSAVLPVDLPVLLPIEIQYISLIFKRFIRQIRK